MYILKIQFIPELTQQNLMLEATRKLRVRFKNFNQPESDVY